MNELQTQAINAIDELTGEVSTMYCSINANTTEEKALIFNAISNTDESLSDHIGETLKITDVIAHQVDMFSDAEGANVKMTRVILIDENGKTYGCVSTGIMSALKLIFPIVGMPPYNPPIPLKVIQKTGRKGYKFLSVAVDMGNK